MPLPPQPPINATVMTPNIEDTFLFIALFTVLYTFLIVLALDYYKA